MENVKEEEEDLQDEDEGEEDEGDQGQGVDIDEDEEDDDVHKRYRRKDGEIALKTFPCSESNIVARSFRYMRRKPTIISYISPEGNLLNWIIFYGLTTLVRCFMQPNEANYAI